MHAVDTENSPNAVFFVFGEFLIVSTVFLVFCEFCVHVLSVSCVCRVLCVRCILLFSVSAVHANTRNTGKIILLYRTKHKDHSGHTYIYITQTYQLILLLFSYHLYLLSHHSSLFMNTLYIYHLYPIFRPHITYYI